MTTMLYSTWQNHPQKEEIESYNNYLQVSPQIMIDESYRNHEPSYQNKLIFEIENLIRQAINSSIKNFNGLIKCSNRSFLSSNINNMGEGLQAYTVFSEPVTIYLFYEPQFIFKQADRNQENTKTDFKNTIIHELGHYLDIKRKITKSEYFHETFQRNGFKIREDLHTPMEESAEIFLKMKSGIFSLSPLRAKPKIDHLEQKKKIICEFITEYEHS